MFKPVATESGAPLSYCGPPTRKGFLRDLGFTANGLAGPDCLTVSAVADGMGFSGAGGGGGGGWNAGAEGAPMHIVILLG